MNFQCWPESRIIFKLYNSSDSDKINVILEYDYDFEGKLKFKNIDKYDGKFSFITSTKDIITFYEDLKQEYKDELKPKRILLTKNEVEEEPWDDELQIIKKQKLIVTNKPVILIDFNLIRNCHKEYNNFKSTILRLLKNFKVAIIGIESSDKRLKKYIRISEELKDIIFLEKQCYPLNKELIYLRDNHPVDSYLSFFCCLDRAITTIWFPSYCNSDWEKAYKAILECVGNLPEIMKLSEDDGTCGYVI